MRKYVESRRVCQGLEPKVGYYVQFVHLDGKKPKVLVRPEFDLCLGMETELGRGRGR
jgi:hypothetical protein